MLVTILLSLFVLYLVMDSGIRYLTIFILIDVATFTDPRHSVPTLRSFLHQEDRDLH